MQIAAGAIQQEGLARRPGGFRWVAGAVTFAAAATVDFTVTIVTVTVEATVDFTVTATVTVATVAIVPHQPGGPPRLQFAADARQDITHAGAAAVARAATCDLR